MTNPSDMLTKTYLAKTVDLAIAQAREELGPDAMLLNTRRLPGEPGTLGGYEVVFTVHPPEPEPQPQPEPQLFVAPASAPPSEDLAADLARLHAQMDEIRNLLMRPTKAQFTPIRTAPELADIYDCLVASDVEPSLSKDIVDRLEASRSVDAHLQKLAPRREKLTLGLKRTANYGPDDLEAFVVAELERRVPVKPRLGQNGVVLVGPPGAGKTTTVAKLAGFISAFTGTRPVRLISLDPSTDVPHLRLKEIALTLGIGFTKMTSLQTLPALIAEARRSEFLLIDTPGFAANDRTTAEAAAHALAGCPGMDVHLVVPGYMKSLDLRRAIHRYEIFRPAKLLVTKLDETHSFGSVFSEASRAGLALSFLAHGPAIPSDIRPASPDDLLALALDRNQARAASVA